jgi:acyl-CoA dehydrogenase
LRDSRISPIYEGTNGIQAIDLVTRKLPLAGGNAVRALVDELRATIAALGASNAPDLGATRARLAEAVDSLERATTWLLAELGVRPEAALAGATPYLRLLAVAAGGCALAEEAMAACRVEATAGNAAHRDAAITVARFFADHVTTTGVGLERAVVEGSDVVNAAEPALSA